MHEVFDLEGVLVGWIGYSKAVGCDVFMPRRHKDIDADRVVILEAARIPPRRTGAAPI
jgi:hypothetical protein